MPRRCDGTGERPRNTYTANATGAQNTPYNLTPTTNRRTLWPEIHKCMVRNGTIATRSEAEKNVRMYTQSHSTCAGVLEARGHKTTAVGLSEPKSLLFCNTETKGGRGVVFTSVWPRDQKTHSSVFGCCWFDMGVGC